MAATGVPFRKMHGLGNDFVVVDARTRPFVPTAEDVRRIADRRTGVGCDQLVTIERPRPEYPGTAAFLGLRNADGGVVEACGNATRCVARLLMDEAGVDAILLGSLAGPLSARRAEDDADAVCVDMGSARPDAAVLSRPEDPLHLDLGLAPFFDSVAVSVGNPHVVALVEDAEAVDLAAIGPTVENHPLFPNRVNVEVVHRADSGVLRMRVWERGVGITRACGTGACAVVVAAVVRGLIARQPTTVRLDGGALRIDWRETDDHVLMTGPVATAFTGHLNGSLLA